MQEIIKTKNPLIARAETWVENVWHDVFSRWSARSGQDKSYRWHVIHPAIVSILKKLYHERHLSILELGCGDGVLLDDPETGELVSGEGRYLGVDLSIELLEKAREYHHEGNVSFLQGNLSDNDLARKILGDGSEWDCVLSIFVVQEIPDIESFMGNLSKLLEKCSRAVIVTVHPDFAEWLEQTGSIQIINELNGLNDNMKPRWRWVGLYPIVDEPDETFYLPHFHRTLEDYRSLLNRSGIVVEQVIEIPDKHNELPLLVKQGFSPFTPFEKNIYWPRIGEEPSALAIIARKETERG